VNRISYLIGDCSTHKHPPLSIGELHVGLYIRSGSLSAHARSIGFTSWRRRNATKVPESDDDTMGPAFYTCAVFLHNMCIREKYLTHPTRQEKTRFANSHRNNHITMGSTIRLFIARALRRGHGDTVADWKSSSRRRSDLKSFIGESGYNENY
jgi:hypothetical protein